MTATKMPPWTTQAKNVGGAISRAVKALATNQPVLAPVDATSIRAQTCATCPDSTPRDAAVKDRRCTACGCFLAAKIALATESCPKGKW
jgi:hypothetical protein